MAEYNSIVFFLIGPDNKRIIDLHKPYPSPILFTFRNFSALLESANFRLPFPIDVRKKMTFSN